MPYGELFYLHAVLDSNLGSANGACTSCTDLLTSTQQSNGLIMGLDNNLSLNCEVHQRLPGSSLSKMQTVIWTAGQHSQLLHFAAGHKNTVRQSLAAAPWIDKIALCLGFSQWFAFAGGGCRAVPLQSSRNSSRGHSSHSGTELWSQCDQDTDKAQSKACRQYRLHFWTEWQHRRDC